MLPNAATGRPVAALPAAVELAPPAAEDAPPAAPVAAVDAADAAELMAPPLPEAEADEPVSLAAYAKAISGLTIRIQSLTGRLTAPDEVLVEFEPEPPKVDVMVVLGEVMVVTPVSPAAPPVMVDVITSLPDVIVVTVAPLAPTPPVPEPVAFAAGITVVTRVEPPERVVVMTTGAIDWEPTAPRVVVTGAPVESVPVLITRVLVPAVCVIVETPEPDAVATMQESMPAHPYTDRRYLPAQIWLPKAVTALASEAGQDSATQSRIP